MQLAHLLFTQGFGTRRVCAGMVQAGMVSIAGRVVDAFILPGVMGSDHCPVGIKLAT